jgi:hypothetical protein
MAMKRGYIPISNQIPGLFGLKGVLMSNYAKNPYEEPEPPRCPSCDECKTEVPSKFSGQARWECKNPLCEDSSEYNSELVELYSLRKILVMADRLLLAVETDGTVSVEDEKRLRKEIEKVKSL